jgi:hypothetical protein
MKKGFPLASLFIFFTVVRVGYGLEEHPAFGPFPTRTGPSVDFSLLFNLRAEF